MSEIQTIAREQIIKKLEVFNKFAEELFNLSFVKKLQGSGYKISAKQGEAIKVEFRGPDDEAIKAFINDIRRFFQKGDDTLKIHKLIPIYQSTFIDDSEKKLFNQVMSELDSFNKQTTNHIINGENITNERILDVFFYGKFSHRTERVSEVHDHWERIPPMYISLKNEFITVLHTYLIFINNIVYANNQVLRKFKQNESTTTK